MTTEIEKLLKENKELLEKVSTNQSEIINLINKGALSGEIAIPKKALQYAEILEEIAEYIGQSPEDWFICGTTDVKMEKVKKDPLKFIVEYDCSHPKNHEAREFIKKKGVRDISDDPAGSFYFTKLILFKQ